MDSNDNSNPIIAKCTFSGNSAVGVGGGMNNYNCAPTVTNCTFSLNRADTAGGVYNFDNAAPRITNCILWGDSGGEMSSLVNPAYSNVEGNPATPDTHHNFGADPRFIRNPSPSADNQWGTADDDFGDLRLLTNSPCINKGSAAAPSLPIYDKVGYNRIAGLVPDQGSYKSGSATYITAHLYVDKATGSDTTGNGTTTAPFQTVTRALSMGSSSIGFTVIHVRAENYGSDRPRVMERGRFVNWGNTGQARIGKP